MGERCGDGDGFGVGESNSAPEKVGKVGVVVGGIGGDEDTVLVGDAVVTNNELLASVVISNETTMGITCKPRATSRYAMASIDEDRAISTNNCRYG